MLLICGGELLILLPTEHRVHAEGHLWMYILVVAAQLVAWDRELVVAASDYAHSTFDAFFVVARCLGFLALHANLGILTRARGVGLEGQSGLVLIVWNHILQGPAARGLELAVKV